MYRKVEPTPSSAQDFKLPFEGKLAATNRWVQLAELIPWSEFESEYAQNFVAEVGPPAKSFRLALGSLIIKEKLGISDRETVEQIRENPYLQYFIGYLSYSNEEPFDPSLFVHFRQRISDELVNKVNREVVRRLRELVRGEGEKKNPEAEREQPKNQGKLILDATCAPADISYPTDLKLLNQARFHTEKIIDLLYEPLKEKIQTKPRTYRQIAKKEYLKVAKQRRPTRKQKRKALKKQLQYIKRNLGHIEQLIESGGSLLCLKKRQYKTLLVVKEVYRQQLELFQKNQQSIEDRIVSLSQPQIRPIVRGKAGKPVEFGAKLSASCFEGYVFVDRISWDNFNESGDLKTQIEAYRSCTGYYPESVHVDKIYRTRDNRAWCKERGIRISGPPLGRPPAHVSLEKKKQAAYDERIRSSIEGKFGQGKRRFSLSLVMTKLENTSRTSIAISFLVMNLAAGLRQLLSLFLCLFSLRTTQMSRFITSSYVRASVRQLKLNARRGIESALDRY
ncbi:MAG TPA: IS5 family transposase [Phormidium sp.]